MNDCQQKRVFRYLKYLTAAQCAQLFNQGKRISANSIGYGIFLDVIYSFNKNKTATYCPIIQITCKIKGSKQLKNIICIVFLPVPVVT